MESGSPIIMERPPRFISVSHEDELIRLLQDEGARNPMLIANPVTRKFFPETASLLERGLSLYKQRFQVNVNTLARFAPLWVRNLARNLDRIAASPGLAEIEGAFAGMRGLLVAGGPSLDEVLPSLPALRKRYLVVAVDTSLRACLRAGVDPDFVVIVDPQYWNTRHLDGCGTSRAIMISESAVFPRALRQTSGPVLMFQSLFPLGKFFEEGLGPRGAIGAGGSVATSAWDFMRFLGLESMVAAGLDLSFPKGATHFRGSVFEENAHGSSRRLCPAEHLRYSYLFNAGTREVPAVGGESVLSDRRMDVYVQWFEMQRRLHPEFTSLRLGSGTRVIDGFTHVELGDCMKTPEIRGEIDKKLAWVQGTIARDKASQDEERRAKIEKSRKALVTELEALKELSARGREICVRAAAPDCGSAERNRLLESLDQIDAHMMDSPDSRIAGFLLEDLIQKISVSEKPKGFEEAISRSKSLYEGILESCSYHLELFRIG